MSPQPTAPPRDPNAPNLHATSRAALFVVMLVTLASRVAYWPSGIVGKDGELYINAMKLDSTYNVPMPGNLGWVLLGKLFHTLGLSDVNAFTLVGVLVSVLGTAYFYLLAARFLRPWVAAITAVGMALSPMVWYHAPVLMSYEVWLCVPAAIAHYGLCYMETRRLSLLYAAALATGIGTILRPDMVVFGGLLFAGVLTISRAPLLKGWGVSAAICGACCCLWFFWMSSIFGGVEEYLSRVNAKNEFNETFSAVQKGAFEGLARNTAKFGIFYLWGAAFVTPPAAWGLLRVVRSLRTSWRAALLGLLAILPSLYFGTMIFMGNAGLVLPTVGVAFLLAAYALSGTSHDSAASRKAAWIMGMIGLLGAAQFMLAPLINPPRNQREAIYDVTFARYSGRAIRRLYDFNLTDYNIDSSLSNTIRQIKNPEPVPVIPKHKRPWPFDPDAPPPVDLPQAPNTAPSAN